MELNLSRYEVERLIDAQKTLLSPFNYRSRADWLLRSLSAIGLLIGADAAAAHDPDDPRFVISSEYSSTLLAPYREFLSEAEAEFIDHSMFSALGAWNRKLVYADRLDTYYRSRYFNEFIVPARGYDAVGLSVSLSGRNDMSDTLNLIFHHSTMKARQFGERGLMLLQLLYPAFRAGADMMSRFAAPEELMGSMIDALGGHVRMYDIDGNALHQTEALDELLSENGASQPLSDAMDRLSSEILAVSSSRKPVSLTKVEDVVQTGMGRFRIRAAWVPPGAVGTDPCLLMLLDPLDDLNVDVEQLTRAFGLTRREAQVTLLLMQRKSNREIARTLVISEHTARHHTERVMAKLRVHSRREVRDRLTNSK